MTIKLHHVVALVLTLALCGAAAAADKFGQNVPAHLEKKVLQARLMRLPYQKDRYDPKKSAKLLEEVVAAKPDYYRAYFNLGLTYHELGDYEKSTVAFDKALRIRREQKIDDFTLINTAGWVSLKNGDLIRAERLLLIAAKATKGTDTYTEGAVHSNLGEVYFLTQRFDDARRHLTIASEKFGSRDAAYYLDLINRTEQVLMRQQIQIEKRTKRRAAPSN
ncbi:tetratricopeptide repeat protein [Nitratireductor sp. XY-223]|uniref:tetratricopeptide repeat protein n=1 Tax=Nitratireductor sp. XY-223 TaxID=2561926 RepID=UPI0010AAC95E|nr:tetratricopeptide repeat protein [Nitratireductor sp. XY-223]